MSSRGKSISVKIATSKVIAALESALAKLEKQYADQDALEAKYQKSVAAYNKEVARIALANATKTTDVTVHHRIWSPNVEVTLTFEKGKVSLPELPTRDFETIHRHEYNTQVAEITNAIRILKMTDEEVVSTSTYDAVARYL